MSIGSAISRDQRRIAHHDWTRRELTHLVIGSEPWRWTSSNSAGFAAVMKRRS
jgi:hypothetical protein